MKEHKRKWLCQFLGFKILTSYFLASWHLHLAGVYRVLQRTWRGKHQRQFCDYLRIVRWVGRLRISTIYRDKDPPGVSWLSLCTLVSCVCIQINLTFSFVLIKIIYLSNTKIQCTTVYSSRNLFTIELQWMIHDYVINQCTSWFGQQRIWPIHYVLLENCSNYVVISFFCTIFLIHLFVRY